MREGSEPRSGPRRQGVSKACLVVHEEEPGCCEIGGREGSERRSMRNMNWSDEQNQKRFRRCFRGKVNKTFFLDIVKKRKD